MLDSTLWPIDDAAVVRADVPSMVPLGHGSLHRSDSLGALLWCGTGPDTRQARAQWSLRDIAPMVRAHFGALEPLVPGAVGSDQ